MADAARRRVLTLVAVALANVLAVVDYTVVSVAVPDLLRMFPGTTLPQASWVINGYTVVFAATLLPAGGFADRYGAKRLFLGGIVCFTVASLGCAFAPDIGWLVLARMAQAVGGGAMVTTTLSLALSVWPDRRSRVVGLLGMVGGVATAGAPSLGAALLALGGWHLVFLINVPIAAVLVACAGFGLRTDPPAVRAGLPEIPGAVALAASMGLLALYLVQGAVWGWAAPASLGIVAVAVVLAAFGTYRSWRHPRSALDLRLLAARPTALGNVAVVLLSVVQFTVVLCVALFLTDRWGYSEALAGLALTPGPVISAACSLLGGRIVARLGARGVAAIGCLVGAAGWGWFALGAGPEPAYLTRLLPALVAGFGGTSLAAVAVTTLAVSAIPKERFGMAGGLTMMSRSLGAAIGVAGLAGTLASPSTRGFVVTGVGITACLLGMLAVALATGRPAPVTAPARAGDTVAP